MASIFRHGSARGYVVARPGELGNGIGATAADMPKALDRGLIRAHVAAAHGHILLLGRLSKDVRVRNAIESIVRGADRILLCLPDAGVIYSVDGIPDGILRAESLNTI